MTNVPLCASRDDSLDLLIRELRQAVGEAAATPPSLAVAAQPLLTWRTIDADLEAASLCFDSAFDARVLVRGPAGSATRSLVFAGTGDIALEVDVRGDEVSGRVVAAGPRAVCLHAADGTSRSVPTDADGWFRFAPAPRGPHRFECRTDAGALVTAWTLI